MPPVDVYEPSDFVNYAVPASENEMQVPLGVGVLRISGVHVLSREDVRSAMARARSLADAADVLADAYEHAGWRNVLVVPVATTTPPMLVVHEGGLSRVEGYEPLRSYFEPFVGNAPIDYSSFAIAAQLADLHSSRTGSDADAFYARSVQQPTSTRMIVREDRTHHSPFDYQVRMGNEGNRFVGRWLGGVDATWTAESSARLGLSYDRVLPELGGSRGHPKYDGFSAFTDVVTRYGLVKLVGSYADYAYDGIGAENIAFGVPDADPRFKASSLGIGTQAERYLFISPTWRWSAAAGATYSRYDIEQVGTAASASEAYTAVHIGGGGRWYAERSAGRPQAFVDAQLRQSVSDRFEGTGARGGFHVAGYGGGVSADPFGYGRASLSWEAQYTTDPLPQSEQWVLGGLSRLSAWLPGVAVGDRGTFAQARYEIPVYDEDRHDLKVALAVERGTSRFASRSPDLASTLSCASLGVIYRYARNWVVEARIGEPLEEHAPESFAVDQQRADFYFRMARSFDVH